MAKRQRRVADVAARYVRRYGTKGTTWKTDRVPRYSGPSTNFNKKRQGAWWKSGESWGSKSRTARRAERGDLVNTAVSDLLKSKGVTKASYGNKRRQKGTHVGGMNRSAAAKKGWNTRRRSGGRKKIGVRGNPRKRG